MKRFEYNSVRIPIDNSLVGELNVLGDLGWQVVSMDRFRHYTDVVVMREVDEESLQRALGGRMIKHTHSVQFPCIKRCPHYGTPNEVTL